MDGLVFGRYRITHKIAEGGMAEVYAARHELINRNAAIKLLLPAMSEQHVIVKRFFNEAQIAASIKHPGIVDVFDVGYTPEGRAYLVMEMLSGETLSERIHRTGAAPIEVARTWMRQLAGALGAAHAHGIVHRDLKPGNLFLVPDPEVPGGERIKILDFGLAKLAEYAGSVLTKQGAIFGTPAYMAPEQCRNAAAVDGRADLYAIGCIFYHCLCGQPPFRGDGLALLSAQLGTPPVPPRQLRPEIPPELDALILQLLEKDPARRIPSCEDLIAALDTGDTSNAPVVPISTADDATLPVTMPRAATSASRDSANAMTPMPGMPALHVPQPPQGARLASPGHEVFTGSERAPSSSERAPSSSEWAPGSSARWMGQVSEPAPRQRSMAAWIVLALAAGLLSFGIVGVVLFWRGKDHPVGTAPLAAAGAQGSAPVATAAAKGAVSSAAELDALLAEAEQATSHEDWAGALKLLDRAASLGIEDSTREERRLALEQRSRAELQNQIYFEHFSAAKLENDLSAMAENYARLPEVSIYRGRATQQRDQWLTEMLPRLRASSRARTCESLPTANTLAESLERLFPENPPGAQALRKACAGP